MMVLLLQLSAVSTGRISIRYRRVECVPPGKMSVVLDNNNGPSGWLRMFVAVRKHPSAPECLAAECAGSMHPLCASGVQPPVTSACTSHAHSASMIILLTLPYQWCTTACETAEP